MNVNKRVKRLVFFVASGWLVLWGCGKCLDNMQTVSDNYQNRFSYGGTLEQKYAQNGPYQVGEYSITDEEERIKSHDIYYPTNLKTSSRRWPLVVMANGTGTPARKYKAVFRHLASWGFIVVGNQEEWTWEGKSSNKSQDLVLRESNNPQSVLYHKVDSVRIGIVGHSQGGMAVYTAASLFWNSKRYKALCTQSGTASLLADSLGWEFLKDIRAPMLMMGGTGYLDDNGFCKLEDMLKTYKAIGSVQKILGRIRNTDHSDMLARGDAYMTAWMRYWLCDDTVAAKCFIGDEAEILTNMEWQDVKCNSLIHSGLQAWPASDVLK